MKIIPTTHCFCVKTRGRAYGCHDRDPFLAFFRFHLEFGGVLWPCMSCFAVMPSDGPIGVPRQAGDPQNTFMGIPGMRLGSNSCYMGGI